jgi:hypothetical protein
MDAVLGLSAASREGMVIKAQAGVTLLQVHQHLADTGLEVRGRWMDRGLDIEGCFEYVSQWVSVCCGVGRCPLRRCLAMPRWAASRPV